MQIEFTSLTKEWKPFSEITTISASATYRIQNRGADPLIALEADTTPSNTEAGVVVLPNCTISYKKGEQNLYLRAFNSNCSINVTQGE